jgi:hypothetical protein
MPLALLLSLVISPAHASMQACRQHTKEVLVAAVTEDTKATDQPFRMPKEEAKALSFIKKFDVKKLGLADNKAAQIKLLKDCDALSNNAARDVFCSSSLPTLNYFRGLIHGVKNHGWSAGTQKMAREQIAAYAKEVTTVTPSMLDTMLVGEVLNYAAKEKIGFSLEEKATAALVRDMEEGSSGLQMELRSQKPPMTCDIFKTFAAKEIKLAQKNSEKLKAQLPKLTSK